MEIHLDTLVSRAAAPRVQHAVFQALRGRVKAGVRVYVSRPHPGRWSVFISGLPEHPLAVTEMIEAALARGERADLAPRAQPASRRDRAAAPAD
jgi:hypothetical protein